MTLHTGDCLEVMAGMPDASVDAVVTDPPYGLEFMGKGWDAFKSPGRGARVRKERAAEMTAPGRGHTTSKGPFLAAGVDQYIAGTPYQAWCTEWGREALRVTVPGGYLLAFGGSRTSHRLVSGLEDAGWEIRDTLMWCHAQGFPKSRNVTADLERAVPEDARCACAHRSTRIAPGSQDGYRPELDSDGGRPRPVGDSDLAVSPSRGGARGRSRGGPSADDQVLGLAHSPALASSARPSIADSPIPSPLQAVGSPASDSEMSGMASSTSDSQDGSEVDRTPARTPSIERSDGGSAAASWSPPRGDAFPYSKCTTCGGWRVVQGLGTALKPAMEPIVLARKPLAGNVAANVARHGTGALNIDGCRIPGTPQTTHKNGNRQGTHPAPMDWGEATGHETPGAAARWPANVILTDPVFDGGVDGVVGGGEAPHTGGLVAVASESSSFGGGRHDGNGFGDSGTYSRFFLVPKSSRSDREPAIPPEWYEDGKRSNSHPTCKPIELMRHLVRLVTPPGGTVLDPFLGSGTTAIACEMEGFAWIGIEKEPEYVAIAEARLNGVQKGLGLV